MINPKMILTAAVVIIIAVVLFGALGNYIGTIEQGTEVKTATGYASTTGTFLINPVTTIVPSGAGVTEFTAVVKNQTWLNLSLGRNATIPDADQLSPATSNNQTTISFWVYVPSFNFKGQANDAEFTNYIAKLDYPGAPTGNQVEWEFRMENATGDDGGEKRPCRFSFYAFSKNGGLGTGSYFQDNSTANTCPTMNNTWINVVGRINGTNTAIFKNGVLRDTDLLSNYAVNLSNTNSSIRLGSDLDGGLWNGQLSDIRIYNRSLSNDEVYFIYALGRQPND